MSFIVFQGRQAHSVPVYKPMRCPIFTQFKKKHSDVDATVIFKAEKKHALQFTRTDSKASLGSWCAIRLQRAVTRNCQQEKREGKNKQTQELVKCVTRWPGGQRENTPQHCTMKWARNIKQHFCSSAEYWQRRPRRSGALVCRTTHQFDRK